jgi:hypothetical protein
VLNLVTHEGGTKVGIFEKWVLRKIYGPRTDEVAGQWRSLHNEESASNVIPVIKPRRMRWAEHVASMGRGRLHTGLRQRGHLKDPGIDHRVILKCIIKR